MLLPPVLMSNGLALKAIDLIATEKNILLFYIVTRFAVEEKFKSFKDDALNF